MAFNNIINHLRLWCIRKAQAYHKTYANFGGITYIGYQIAYEMEFKLSTLIDKAFDSPEDLKKAIFGFADVHYEPSLLNPENSLPKAIIDKTNRSFYSFLNELFTQEESLPPADIPYSRVIIGAEATALQDRFRSVWEYENTAYWFPLMGDEPKKISDKFFIMFEYLEPYMEQLEQIIGLPHTHLYSYGEDCFRPSHCIETVEFMEYGGCETIFTDKEFTWVIYFSHENTVSFAGSIVPKVKELLSPIKAHWNRFESDF